VVDNIHAVLCDDDERCVALCVAWWKDYYRCCVALAQRARFDDDARPREDHCDVLRTARRKRACSL
jgi:hypothetical protein